VYPTTSPGHSEPVSLRLRDGPSQQIQEKRAREGRRERPRTECAESPCPLRLRIIETLECGIMLSGSEVKSLREASPNRESYAASTTRMSVQMHVPRVTPRFGSHDPTVVAALSHRHELDQWQHETRTEPLTMVPLSCTSRRKQGRAGAREGQEVKIVDSHPKRDADRDIARAIRHTEK